MSPIAAKVARHRVALAVLLQSTTYAVVAILVYEPQHWYIATFYMVNALIYALISWFHYFDLKKESEKYKNK